MANPNPENQWKPGQSGNPKGRPPKQWTWAGLLKEAAEEVHPTKKRQYKRVIIENLVEMASDGDLAAIREIMDRTDGKPKQSTQLDFKDAPSAIIFDFGATHEPEGADELPGQAARSDQHPTE